MRNFGGKKDKNGNVVAGGYNAIVHYLCCFPAYINNKNDDISTENTSEGMVETFFKLFNEKKLLHNYTPPYCIVQQNDNKTIFSTIAINAEILRMKSIFYWIRDSSEKKMRQPDEIETLFKKYYQNLTLSS